MSRSRVAGHAVLTFTTMVLTTIIGLGIRVLLTRALGPEGFGQYAAIILVPTLTAAFLNMGVNVSAIHLVGSGRVPPRDAGGVALLVPLIASLIAVPALAYIAPTLSARYLDGADVSGIRIAAFALPAILVAVCVGGVLQGLGRLVAYNAISVSGPLLSLGVLVVAALSDRIVLGSALGAWLVLQASGAIVAIALLARGTGVRVMPRRAAVARMLRLGLWPYVGNTLGLASRRVDSLVLVALLGTRVLGPYWLAVAMAELFWFTASAAAIALAPEVARRGKEDTGALTAATCRVVTLIMGGTLLTWLIVDRWLVTLLFGVSFAPAVAPLRMLFPAIIAASVEKVIVADLTGRGALWVAPMVSSVAFAVSIGGNLLLVRPFGAIGAAAATSAGACASTILTLWVYRRLSGQRWRAMLVPRLTDLTSTVRAGAALVTRRWATSDTP